MTAIRPERLGADRTVPEKTGPEVYAPNRKSSERRPKSSRRRRPLSRVRSANLSGATSRYLRRQRNDVEQPAPEPVADNLNVLIRRVSGASMDEIDRVILELQGVREMLRSEGERVSREIAGYASLSHAAMTAMKVIGDSLTQWKSAPNNSGSARRRLSASMQIAIAENSGDGCFDLRTP